MPSGSAAFDADYYRRFYRDPSTRVTDAKTTARLARFVRSYLDMLELDIKSVLDLGCGLGWWDNAVESWKPRCRYTGVEYSEYLVHEHGWQHGSVLDFESPNSKPYDLVICQGVLQYLAKLDAKLAIENLAKLSGQALYLEALTSEDWDDNCDTDRTDGNVHLRPGSWYRKRLKPHFFNCGGGLFIKRDAPVALFDLEHLSRP